MRVIVYNFIKVFGTFLLIFCATICCSQSTSQIEWTNCYGGFNDADYFHCVIQTFDGGYITAGYSSSVDGDLAGLRQSKADEDFWIVKLSPSGAIEWQKV